MLTDSFDLCLKFPLSLKKNPLYTSQVRGLWLQFGRRSLTIDSLQWVLLLLLQNGKRILGVCNARCKWELLILIVNFTSETYQVWTYTFDCWYKSPQVHNRFRNRAWVNRIKLLTCWILNNMFTCIQRRSHSC